MKNILSLIFIIFSLNLQAQTIADALRYSNLEVGGTARTVAVGGALGALGADYSVLSTNPAGLAMFRSNEFVITPGVFNSTTSSTLNSGSGNSSNDEASTKFTLYNIGMVLNNRPRRSKWRTSNFGIGYNRLATFNQEFVFKGKSTGTIVERFTELANDGVFDDFEVALADNAFALLVNDNNTPNIPEDDFYTNDFQDPLTDPDYELEREQLVRRSGSYSELVFSMAGNYDEKLMIGATLGVPLITFEEEKIYKESNADSSVAFFNDLEFQENITTSGIGINLKVGMIYRINQMFRVGASVHTPTALSLDDGFTNQFNYDFTDGGGNSDETATSPEGTFNYRLRTPWRAMASVAAIINKQGFLSADIEYVDYSSASFNLTAESESIEDEAYQKELNDQISNDLQGAINLRFGGEYAYQKFRFRAGYTISGTPYADRDITNNAYSLGLGYRQRSFYLDFAFKNNQIDEEYTPYLLANPELEQKVSNEVRNSQFLLTAGFKF